MEDARPDRGPLEGILAGLRTLSGPTTRAFVCASTCPVPGTRSWPRASSALLRPADDAAVPRSAAARHPLAAAYRARLATTIAERARAPAGATSWACSTRCGARALDAATLLADPALAAADPDLDGLRNLNTPAELAAARARRSGQARDAHPGAGGAVVVLAAARRARSRPASDVTA